MRVIQTIQTTLSDTEAPVEMPYYTGDSFAQALSAVAMIAADAERTDLYYRILDVRIVF